MTNVFKCLRPRILTNVHGERVTVSCGYCAACLTKKASQRAKLCVLEADANKYCWFCTLTYAQENLPVASVRHYGDTYYLINETERLKGQYENDCVGVVNNPHHLLDVPYIFEKVYNPNAKTPFQYGEGFIPYCSKTEAQLFMKRLRYYISEYCKQNEIENEKVRYYIAAEYGPDHFRPHLHVLLFFNSSWLTQELPGLLSKSWTFGNIDDSEVCSREGCSSYVASYVNSFSYLPSLYQSKGIAPFALHSLGFGQARFRPQYESVLKGEHRETVSVGLLFGNEVRECFAPLSLSNTLLPRCYRYVQSSDYVRYQLLRVFGDVVAKYAIEEPSVACVSAVINYIDPSIRERLSNVLGIELSEENVETIVKTSFNYYRLCQKYPVHDVRHNIDKYYSDMSLRRLKKFYESQSEFVERYGEFSREFLVHYYDNVYVKGMSLSECAGLDASDLERSKRFYDSININWEFVDSDSLSYPLNPSYLDAQQMAHVCLKTKNDKKKYNDYLLTERFNY